MEPRLTEICWTEKNGDVLEEVEGFYMGLSYRGSFDTSMNTLVMAIRRNDGKVVELYPSKVRFKKISDDHQE